MKISKKGLSLVETVVVVAIIAALAGISIPIYGKFRNKAEVIACQENLREIGGGLEFYLQDHNSRMPEIDIALQQNLEDAPEDAPTLRNVLTPYVGSEDCFMCPADKMVHPVTGCSYAWNSLINDQHRARLDFLGNKNDLKSIPVVFDIEAFHGDKDGTNFLYADYSSGTEVSFQTTP